MEKLNDIQRLFYHQLAKIYSAESQLIEALLYMRDKTGNEDLHLAFIDHQKKKKLQRDRLEKIGRALNINLLDSYCEPMKKMIDKAVSLVSINTGAGSPDINLVEDAQRIQDYEVQIYETALDFAKKLKLDVVAKQLQESLEEEQAAGKKLKLLAKKVMNPNLKKTTHFAK